MVEMILISVSLIVHLLREHFLGIIREDFASLSRIAIQSEVINTILILYRELVCKLAHRLAGLTIIPMFV